MKRTRGNNKGYFPENCKGALIIGISGDALRRRINAWGLEKALITKKYETRIGNTNWDKKCG